LLAVDGRFFQSFKGTNPRIIDFGLPVESGLSFFFVAEGEPLLRGEILEIIFNPRRLVPKSASRLTPVNLNFLLRIGCGAGP
jgi:hypothetical protein